MSEIQKCPKCWRGGGGVNLNWDNVPYRVDPLYIFHKENTLICTDHKSSMIFWIILLYLFCENTNSVVSYLSFDAFLGLLLKGFLSFEIRTTWRSKIRITYSSHNGWKMLPSKVGDTRMNTRAIWSRFSKHQKRK